jgi:transposase
MRRRGELIERSFAHLYDTGGMRRTHLRGHTNILKRLLIHAGGFNLGLLLRALLGVGTPRGLQDLGGRAVAAVLDLIHIFRGPLAVKVVTWSSIPASRDSNCLSSPSPFVATEIVTCTTGC